MKLLGWTIVASGLLLGLAACTVTSEDTTTDGGTAGTGGTAGAAGAAGGGTGGVAGAAGTAGTAGAAGAATCTPTDPNNTCDVCMNAKCCTQSQACDKDQGNPPDWTTKCGDIWNQAVDCASADGGAKTFQECLQELAGADFNPVVNDLYDCMYTSTCKVECQ